jgi:RHS repeat-associated protein
MEGVNAQAVSYTAFNRVAMIREAVDLGSNGTVIRTQSFTYYSNGDRVSSDYAVNGADNRVRLYLSDYEEETTLAGTTQIAYITSPVGLSIMMVNINGDESINYVYTDHLGSPAFVTDASANIIAKQSYDAWGRPRNADDWLLTTTPSISNPTWLWRGYTGHEMMTEFGLVNMNARLYDYINGRMCEPDIATSAGTQGQSRYSYALNNPLKYSDPSGNFVNLVPALIGGIINVVMNFNNINNIGQFLGYFAVGAVGGLIGAGVGAAITGVVGSVGFTAGLAVGAGSGFAGGFIGGFGNSAVAGNDVSTSFISGLKGGMLGALIGGIANGLVAGVSSVKHGGDFWSGKGAKYISFSEIDSYSESVSDGQLDYNTQTAKEFQECNFPNVDKHIGATNIYADGSTPIPDGNYSYHIDKYGNCIAFNRINPEFSLKVNAISVYEPYSKINTQYYYKGAFTSKIQLYLTMKHEIVHLYFYNIGIYNHGEGNAYIVQGKQEKIWGLLNRVENTQFILNNLIKSGDLFYKQFPFPYGVYPFKPIPNLPW